MYIKLVDGNKIVPCYAHLRRGRLTGPTINCYLISEERYNPFGAPRTVKDLHLNRKDTLIYCHEGFYEKPEYALNGHYTWIRDDKVLEVVGFNTNKQAAQALLKGRLS